MTLGRRIAKLEAGAGIGLAPSACWVYADGRSEVYLWATGAWLDKAEYDRRWPGHPNLKAYTDRRMIDALEAEWADAPTPRSSADV